MFRFNKTYGTLALLLLTIEVMIAVFVHDSFIRPTVGDFLVDILIYCFVQTFCKLPVIKTAIGVLVFSYAVEVLQYFKIVKLLHLEHYTVARIIIGTSFEWTDLIAYTAGICLVVFIEKKYNRNL